jgi:hypothetical protein
MLQMNCVFELNPPDTMQLHDSAIDNFKTLSANAMQSAAKNPVRGAFFATQIPHPIWKIAAMIGRGSYI